MLVMQMHLFENLDFNTKACIAWRKGVHLSFRSQGKYYMSLYRLEDFYVEIQYHTCFDGVAGIKVYQCEDELEHYLNKIDITTILA